MYDYWPVKVLDVHDGDTIQFQADLGLDVQRTFWARLNGVWSPELHDPRGIECRDGVAAKVAEYPAWRVKTFKVGRTDKERMTFIRFVADVMTLDASFSLNAWIVANGYGSDHE
jgi:endonuclease YncB( thermonuclease family)